jgi:hypothetical protein
MLKGNIVLSDKTILFNNKLFGNTIFIILSNQYNILSYNGLLQYVRVLFHQITAC